MAAQPPGERVRKLIGVPLEVSAARQQGPHPSFSADGIFHKMRTQTLLSYWATP